VLEFIIGCWIHYFSLLSKPSILYLQIISERVKPRTCYHLSFQRYC